MSITLAQLTLYGVALLVLFLTPGPVWVAVIARGISGGFWAVLPLAIGVVIGDILWPLLAIFGIAALISLYENFLIILQLIGAAFFIIMGVGLIRYADHSITENKSLTTSGFMNGFIAGLLAITANPKAGLFYLGLLPTFFTIDTLKTVDILAILAISAFVPFCGNLFLAAFMDYIRQCLESPQALRKVNIWAGAAMIAVGMMIALS